MSCSARKLNQFTFLHYIGNSLIQHLQEVGLDDVKVLTQNDVDEVLTLIALH